jgi:competence protein ComEA
MKALALGVAAVLALFAARVRAEPVASTECTCAPAGATESGTAAGGRLVDLNLASEAELLELPGVGPSRARAILAFRESHGGFTSVSQLLRIKGFGRAMLKRLRPFLTLSAAGASGGAAPAVR